MVIYHDFWFPEYHSIELAKLDAFRELQKMDEKIESQVSRQIFSFLQDILCTVTLFFP
jgi:hypothetical protein